MISSLCAVIAIMAMPISAVQPMHNEENPMQGNAKQMKAAASSTAPSDGVRKTNTQKSQGADDHGVDHAAVRRVGVQVTARGNANGVALTSVTGTETPAPTFQTYALGIQSFGLLEEMMGSKTTIKELSVIDTFQSWDQRLVIGGPPTFNGSHPAVVRVSTQGQTPGTLGAWLAESKCSDGGHPMKEEAAYIIVANGSQSPDHVAGTIQVSNGCCGGAQQKTNANWTSVTLPDLGNAPFVFSFSQSGGASYGNQAQYGENYVSIRTRIKPGAAELFLQTDENTTKNQSGSWRSITETVGYLAVRSNCSSDWVAPNAQGDQYGDQCGCTASQGNTCVTKKDTLTLAGGHTVKYEMGLIYTHNTIQHGDRWTDVYFSQGYFSNPPIVLAQMQTTNGNNPSNIRIKKQTRSAAGFRMKVDEDRCDPERKHVPEWVAYMAIENPSTAGWHCKAILNEHWAAGIDSGAATALVGAEKAGRWKNHFKQGETRTLSGTGTYDLESFAGLSSVRVEGKCCLAYAYASHDCSSNPLGGGGGGGGGGGKYIAYNSSVTTNGVSLPPGVVTPAEELVKYWGCNDCARCINLAHDCNPPAQALSGQYDLNPGANCKSGYVPITSSWAECKSAAESLGFAGDSVAHVSYAYPWAASRPQGCFQSDGNNRFHFNTGTGGSFVGADKILCKAR